MGVELLPSGRRLAQWISAGGRVDRAGISSVWAYRWRARWFDHNLRLQQSLFPVRGRLRAPIFVMGFWRSGTTFLHETLTAALAADTPVTWQCFNPSAFRLGAKPRSHRRVQRPMDATLIRTDSPQEDEFALLAAGVDSAYRCFLDPRRWQEVLPTLSEAFWDSPGQPLGWIDRLTEFLEGCVTAEGRPFIVKSPNHLFRGPSLRSHWPQARFVWVLRNPHEVRRSNLKMWRSMAQRYSLWNWDDRDIEALVDHCLDAYLVVLQRLRGRNYEGVDAALRFEELVSAPGPSILQLCTAIGIPEGGIRGPLPAPESRSPTPAAQGAREVGRMAATLEAIEREHGLLLDAVMPGPCNS